MKKLLAVFLTLVMLLSVCGTVFAEDTEASPEPEMEKPVDIAILDVTGAPVSGATLRLSDSDGTVLKTWDSDGEASFFLKEGTYTVENLSVSDDYLEEAEPVEVTVARSEEEQAAYTGSVVYDHAHTDICNKSSHIGLELYTVTGNGESTVAYCFNHGKKNPTGENNYKEYVATPDLLYKYAKNKKDNIEKQDLYDHVLSIIYRSPSVQSAHGLDDTEIRYFAYMAIKNFTDPKCFFQFDANGTFLGHKDENGNYVYDEGGCVLGSIINHARNDHKNVSGYTFPQKYIDAYNDLIGSTQHPSDYYLYFYYPANYDIENDESYQILMSAKQTRAQSVRLAVSPAAQFAVTAVWNDSGNGRLRPSTSSLVSKLQLFADGVDVTAQYRDNLEIADGGDSTYTIRFVKLPKLNENNDEIEYTLEFKSILGYKRDTNVVSNGETVTFTLLLLSKSDLKPVPVVPRPFEPIIGPIKPIKP